MADQPSDETKAPVDSDPPTGESPMEAPVESAAKPPVDQDDDLAVAIAAEQAEQGTESEKPVDVDRTLKEVAPEFEDELSRIASENFDRVVIHKGSAAEAPPPAEEKVPPIWKTYWANLPKESKVRAYRASGILLVTILLSGLIFKGVLLPRFAFPYRVSMEELTTQVYSYPTDGVEIPLFDDFRSKSFTFALPKATLNLRTEGGETAYGEFEFFLNLRDRDLVSLVESKQSDILEIVRAALEDVTWDELETPLGKEKVKKLLRFKINEYLKGNLVLSVYYRSVVLSR